MLRVVRYVHVDLGGRTSRVLIVLRIRLRVNCGRRLQVVRQRGRRDKDRRRRGQHRRRLRIQPVGRTVAVLLARAVGIARPRSQQRLDLHPAHRPTGMTAVVATGVGERHQMVDGKFDRPVTRWRVLIWESQVPDSRQDARFVFRLEPFVQKTERFRVQRCQRVEDLERLLCHRHRHAPRTLEERQYGVKVLPEPGCFRNVGIADQLEREEHPSREDVERSPVEVSADGRVNRLR